MFDPYVNRDHVKDDPVEQIFGTDNDNQSDE